MTARGSALKLNISDSDAVAHAPHPTRQNARAIVNNPAFARPSSNERTMLAHLWGWGSRTGVCHVVEATSEACERRGERIHASGPPETVMARDKLERRIRLGEDPTLELKRVLLAGSRIMAPKDSEFADELAAMANGWGGMAVLGVEDRSREVLGIPLDRLDAVEASVREICNDSVKPPLDALIRKMELPSADGRLVAVLCVEVVRSLFVHKSPGGYFRRIGSSKREMSPEVLARLFQERSQSRVIRFDESPVPGTSPEHLDDGLTRRFLRGTRRRTRPRCASSGLSPTTKTAPRGSRLPGCCFAPESRDSGCHTPQIQAVSYAGRAPGRQLPARCAGP